MVVPVFLLGFRFSLFREPRKSCYEFIQSSFYERLHPREIANYLKGT